MLIKTRAEQLGAHVHVQVFVGKHEGALGRAGTLVMRPEEWRGSVTSSSPARGGAARA
jgi:hypothetical protein